MKLVQAIKRFASVPLSGWDGSIWVDNIAYGDFLTYDRFIGPRSFGHKQRLFLMAGAGAELAPYDVVKTPDGVIFMVLSKNHDENDSGVYATTVLLQRAPFIASIQRLDTTPAPSGLQSGTNSVSAETIHCDFEHYNSEVAREFELVRFGIFIFTLPKQALSIITIDSELLVNNVIYEVKEIYPSLDAAEAKALKRG